jgi:hypothetical protein
MDDCVSPSPANSVRLNYPYNWKDLRRYKARCRKEELEEIS